jgi:transcriptional regulator with XRE-family HTH domain
MPQAHGYIKALLKNIEVLREKAGLAPGQLEERLILGPGWIDRFERGESVPSIDMVLAILHATKATLPDLLQGLPEPEAASVERCIFAEQAESDIIVYFRYSNFDAQYTLLDSSLEEFETVIKVLRNGLARLASVNEKAEGEQVKAIKTDSVARAFMRAVEVSRPIGFEFWRPLPRSNWPKFRSN